MSAAFWLAALLAGCAVWLTLPHPAGRLARLRRRTARLNPLADVVGKLRSQRIAEPGESDLSATLEFLAVSLEAGLPMVRALSVVAAVSGEKTAATLTRISAQLELGRSGQVAWDGLKADPVWAQVAADVARAERSGMQLAGVLRMHAQDVRNDAEDRATVAARTVGVRSVIPLMACFLPAFVLVGVVPIIAGLLGNFIG